MLGFPNRDLAKTPYQINDAVGSISNLAILIDAIHANGLYEYRNPNVYGTYVHVLAERTIVSSAY